MNFHRNKNSTNFNKSAHEHVPQDKNEIKCEDGFVLQNFKIFKNPKNNSEIGYSYTCLKLPIYGCVEINSEKVLICDNTNPFFLFNTTSLSTYTSENRAINRFKLNIEHGASSYFSYTIEVCKIGRRIECPVNNHPYKTPPGRANFNDRLCSGCKEYPNVLKTNESIRSFTDNYRLTMQEDNNLVMYETNLTDVKNTTRAVWATHTHTFKGEYHLFLEPNGKLIIANPKNKSDIIWSNYYTSKISTEHQPAYFLIRTFGVLGLYQCDSAYWAAIGWGREHELKYKPAK